MGELGGKLNISSICKFFSVGSHNAVRICDKMQVVYQEMTHDRGKSNVAKLNFTGGIQFKHVKNCLMFL